MAKKYFFYFLLITTLFSYNVNANTENNPNTENRDRQLENVLILSRHNLRAPLTYTGSALDKVTKKTWPKWSTTGGYLTTKGGILEVFMGNYNREWLDYYGLFNAHSCPQKKDVLIYANSLQRTVATGQFFSSGAFPGCNIHVTHQDAMGKMDPVFDPVIRNINENTKNKMLASMKSALEKFEMKPAFQQLENIIQYSDSPDCKNKKNCHLIENNNIFIIEKNKEPGIRGPIKTGTALVDAFTLQYYEGFPAEQVAWGEIKTPEQWKILSDIKNTYQDILFALPDIAKEVSAPLINYIHANWIKKNKTEIPKVIMMIGHDSNIGSLLAALKVKPYTLPGQNETTPIGGQIVFQRWFDKKKNEDLLKIEYVYQTEEQLRNATPLTLKNPPQRVTLSLTDCPANKEGFCSWNQFIKIMENK